MSLQHYISYRQDGIHFRANCLHSSKTCICCAVKYLCLFIFGDSVILFHLFYNEIVYYIHSLSTYGESTIAGHFVESFINNELRIQIQANRLLNLRQYDQEDSEGLHQGSAKFSLKG